MSAAALRAYLPELKRVQSGVSDSNCTSSSILRTGIVRACRCLLIVSSGDPPPLIACIPYIRKE